jgi:hypothetical protein
VVNGGASWTLDANGQLHSGGTPVLILGAYAFGAPPPWQAPDYWSRKIDLPIALAP